MPYVFFNTERPGPVHCHLLKGGGSASGPDPEWGTRAAGRRRHGVRPTFWAVAIWQYMQCHSIDKTHQWSLECEAQGILLGHVFTVGKQGINLIFAALHGSSVDDQARNAIRGAVPTKACKLLGS